MLTAFGVSESLISYDIYDYLKISRIIKNTIINNIEDINKNVHKDLNNTIIYLNYTNKFEINSEIMLIIHADFIKWK